jgi:hypothetical protein
MKLGDNVRILDEHTKGNKTEKMKTKAQPLEEMIDSGVLTDYTSTTSGADIGELQKITVISSEEEELAKLKTSNAKKQKEKPEMNEEKTENQKTDEQEGAVVAG